MSSTASNTGRYSNKKKAFVKLTPQTGKVVVKGACEFHTKEKFKVGMFGVKKGSRKGFIHTKWRVDGKELHLSDVHLYHDESNLVAAEASAAETLSVYHLLMHFATQRCRHNWHGLLSNHKLCHAQRCRSVYAKRPQALTMNSVTHC
jgi:hypothetical protein